MLSDQLHLDAAPELSEPVHLVPEDLQPYFQEDLQTYFQEESRWQFLQRHQTRLTSGLLGLAVAFSALAFYALPVLARHNLLLSRIAATQSAADSVSARLQDQFRKEKDNDTLLTALLMDQQDLRDKLLGPGAKHRAVSARASDNLDTLRTRIGKLEALSAGDQSRIAGLQQELSQLHAQLERDSRDLNAARQQLDENAAKAGRQIASLAQDQQRANTDVNRIENNLAVDRVAFEVSKGHSTQPVPGISLGLTKTDLARRRADGWMWLMPDRRTIWLRGQNAQEPLTFYGADGRRRELVITQVTRDSVVGYLLLPKRSDAAPSSQRTAASSNDTRN